MLDFRCAGFSGYLTTVYEMLFLSHPDMTKYRRPAFHESCATRDIVDRCRTVCGLVGNPVRFDPTTKRSLHRPTVPRSALGFELSRIPHWQAKTCANSPCVDALPLQYILFPCKKNPKKNMNHKAGMGQNQWKMLSILTKLKAITIPEGKKNAKYIEKLTKIFTSENLQRHRPVTEYWLWCKRLNRRFL